MAAVSVSNSKASPCSRCNNLQRLYSNGHPYRLELQLDGLERSANSGCRFCRLLLSGIDICMPAWDPQQRAKSGVYELEAEVPFKGLGLRLDWYGAERERHMITIDFFTLQRGTARLI